MFKKIMLAGGLALLLVMVGAPNVSAHYPLRDGKTGVEAIFHVTPDHDPIAGRESVISYDFSNSDFNVRSATYVVTVKAANADQVSIPAEVNASVVIANYTFPTRGIYKLSLVVTPNEPGKPTSTIAYTQRVTRGVVERQSLSNFQTYVIVITVLVAAYACIIAVQTSKRKRDPHDPR